MTALRRDIDEPLLPPAYTVTDTDHGAYVLITAVIMVVLSGLAVAFKLHITFSTFRKLRRDDFALIMALVRLILFRGCRATAGR